MYLCKLKTKKKVLSFVGPAPLKLKSKLTFKFRVLSLEVPET